ncbi:hypothetical protein Salat_2761900 [Sesamum alatum]|uniref:CCHC-type domain-containing protein n=1 Tax=Sesamum alatum TaxID=300844 RepID=A0AAE2C919_9LAMI|nr:hypothetical protein Salat_2761900 [Sesamum alatum]
MLATLLFCLQLLRECQGRPKKNRRKEPSEAPTTVKRSSMVKCKACNELGHNRRTCPSIQVNNSRRDSDLNVPLSQLARKRRKSKDQTEAQVGRKRKVATVAQPPAQVSSSQPLFKTQQVPPMHATGSSSQPQPPSHLGAPYLPPSFWRGIGVSPQREIRSKNKNDDKELNSETCTQQ